MRNLLVSAFIVFALSRCGGDDPAAEGDAVVQVDSAGGDTAAADAADSAVADEDASDVASADAGDTADAFEPVCAVAGDCAAKLSLGTCEKADFVDGECVPVSKAAGEQCDDGDKCTAGETCSGGGACGGGTPKTCTDSNPCTDAGACDAATGQCAFAPAASTVACDDGLDCNGADHCEGTKALCVSGPDVCLEDCGNAIDDDGNGVTDCVDEACAVAPSCLGLCSFVDTLTCGQTFLVDPTQVEFTENTALWPCGPGDELAGPEIAYSTAVAEGQIVTITLTGAPPGVALSLLEQPSSSAPSCDKNQCSAQSTVDDQGATSVKFTASAAKRRHVVVDAPKDGAGPFTLEVACGDCVPSCTGKACGSNGCGGSCGSCAAGSSCNSGTCQVASKNDTCEAAAPIPAAGLPFIVSAATGNATDDLKLNPGGACPGTSGAGLGAGGKDVVYAFVPTLSGQYLVSVDATFPASVYVLSACPPDVATGACVGAAGNGAVDIDTAIVDLAMGVPYFIVVDAFAGALSGDYTLTVNRYPCAPSCSGKACGADGCGGSCGACQVGKVCGAAGTCTAPAPNDSCSSALPITTAPYTTTGSTEAAKDDFYTIAGTCPGGPLVDTAGTDAPDLVYAFTAPANGKYQVAVAPTGFDVVLSVLSACPANLLQCEAGSDNVGVATETAEFVLSQGDTRWFVVDGATAGQTGPFSLEVTKVDCTPSCIGKACGADGCGGSCGECAAGESCSSAGACNVVPPNDTCAKPVTIASLPFEGSGDTSGATNDYTVGVGACVDGPTAATYGKGPDVCYVYQATAPGKVKFAFNSAATTFLTYIYFSSSPGVFQVPDCQASSYSPTQPGASVLVTRDLAVGETVYLVVDGWQAKDKGPYVLQASAFP